VDDTPQTEEPTKITWIYHSRIFNQKKQQTFKARKCIAQQALSPENRLLQQHL
jgi:hypothetical protein